MLYWTTLYAHDDELQEALADLDHLDAGHMTLTLPDGRVRVLAEAPLIPPTGLIAAPVVRLSVDDATRVAREMRAAGAQLFGDWATKDGETPVVASAPPGMIHAVPPVPVNVPEQKIDARDGADDAG